MSPGSARYRVRQLLDARAARRDPPDDGPARALLPPPLFDAFRQMPAEDRRHVLTVLADLRDRGESDPALLQAALLHDLGKAGAGVGLIHRVARVLLWRAWPRAWAWLSARPTGWRRPFWVVARHPERGALWVEALGGSPELVALIRHHEAPAPAAWQGQDLARWHAALAWADARS
ncbi:MAG: hypothetical protein KDH92_09090 [Chloroflexi bacterium]|nr:hypothetical protein [Chloroflexota bacterium]